MTEDYMTEKETSLDLIILRNILDDSGRTGIYELDNKLKEFVSKYNQFVKDTIHRQYELDNKLNAFIKDYSGFVHKILVVLNNVEISGNKTIELSSKIKELMQQLLKDEG